MEHQVLDVLRQRAAVLDTPLALSSKKARLLRWADLLEQQTDAKASLVYGFEFGYQRIAILKEQWCGDHCSPFFFNDESWRGSLGIFEHDPFVTLDADGVGELVRIAAARGRAVRPNLKLGICGEHGGDPASIRFCHEAGLDYVSCSPYRVPIARLAAAQAALASGSGDDAA